MDKTARDTLQTGHQSITGWIHTFTVTLTPQAQFRLSHINLNACFWDCGRRLECVQNIQAPH